MMELSNPKILIASDGDKTYVIVNGLPIRCEEFKFYADGCDVSFSIEKPTPGTCLPGSSSLISSKTI